MKWSCTRFVAPLKLIISKGLIMRPNTYKILILGVLSVALVHVLPALAQLFVITGKVISEKSGQPIAGAQVSVTRRVGKDLSEIEASVDSEPDGSFQLPVSSGVSYVLIIEATGYEPVAHPSVKGEFKGKSGTGNLGVIKLAPAGSDTGKDE